MTGKHVFILGRQRAAATAAVRAVIHDWSAVGLVDASIWIGVDDAADDQADGPSVDPVGRTGLLIEGGVASPIELWSWIPRNPGPIRLVAVQVLTDPAQALTSGAVHRVIESLRLPPGTPLVNLLVPVDRLAGVRPDAAFDSQVNVLVQPVDASGPLAASESLRETSPTFSMHAAAALATAAGLWTGMRTAPLDEERPWSGVGVAVGRSFFRRLDATPILDRLSLEVFGAAGSLPVTRSRIGEPMGVVAPAVQQQAAEAAGYAVLNKHAALTRFKPPPAFQAPAAEKIGFFKAFKMFFAFVWRALKNAPQSWAHDVLDRARTRIEVGTSKFLFGDESRFTVVLTGLAAGSADSADQAMALQNAAVGMLGTMAPGSEPATVAAPQLWDDSVRTVAALVDGGESDPMIGLPSQGAARLVVDNPARICPAPGTEPFRLAPGTPGAQFGPIAVNDPWHAMQVDRGLELADRGGTGQPGSAPANVGRLAAVKQARHELAAWVGDRRSTMWAISSGLAAELEKARAMQADILRPVPELTEEELQAPLRAQRRARRMALLWMTLLILLIAVPCALAGFKVIGWAIAAVIAVVGILLCLFGAVISFQRGQRALWQAIHRLQVAAARRQWVQQHAVTVTQEVVRLAGLYRQSRIWSEVVAEYVHAPFGRRPTADDATVPARLSGDLPLAVTVASAQFSPRAHEPVIYQARAQMLRPDWLFTNIDIRRRLVIDDIKERTGRDLENRFASDESLMEGGPLLSYLQGLRDPAVQTGARRAALAGLVKAVGDAGVHDRLLPAVRVDAGAVRREQSWDELTADLFSAPDQLAYEGFSATGVTNRAPAVGRAFLGAEAQLAAGSPFNGLPVAGGDDRHQLDRLVVRWDLSQPVSLEDLTYFGDDSAEPPARGGRPEPIIDVQS